MADAAWEYRIVKISTNLDEAEVTFNTMGLEGWELVQVATGRYVVFKRPISPGPPPEA